MPFRFRKSFKIAPGFRINLSKSGISTSIGKRGASVNLSKRGTRVTTGIPGTGISFSQSLGGRNKQNPNLTEPPHEPQSRQHVPIAAKKPKGKIPLPALIATGAVASVCQIFICLSVISGIVSPSPVTATPTIDLVAVNLTALAQAWQPYTQTALAAVTDTPLPTATLASTETATLAPLPTATLQVFPTSTTFLQALPINQSPTSPPAGQTAVCSCGSDSYNCSDFGSWSSAQACYSYCISQGAGDIHRLDGNNDGSACDALK